MIMIIMVTLRRMIMITVMIMIMVAPTRVIIATETMSKKYKSTSSNRPGLVPSLKWNVYKLTKLEVDRRLARDSG